MRYTLEDIWIEFINDPKSVELHGKDYESYVSRGVKIIKDDKGIKLLSTQQDYYPALRYNLVDVFLEKGYEAGIDAVKKSR